MRSRLFNRLRVVLDNRFTAADALDLACKAHPDSPLFNVDKELPYECLRGNTVSPHQLLLFVNRLGNVLRAAGMRRYDRVAIYKTNGFDYFFLALGIIRAGGIAVPVHPDMQVEQLGQYLKQTGSTFLIVDKDLYGKQIVDANRLSMVLMWIFPHAPHSFAAAHVDLDCAMAAASDQLEPAVLCSDSDILIVHTSGTTGFPKGVVCTSGSIVAGIKGHFKDEPISARNRIAIAGHFNHLACLLGLYTALMGNFRVWSISEFGPRQALELIDREKINVFFGFPDVYLNMLEEGLDAYDLSSMRIWIATADAAHEVHMRAFCQKGAYLRLFGWPLLRSVFVEALGASEVGFAALARYRFSFSKLRFRRLVGRPSWGGPKVKVADELGRRLPNGNVGRLMVKGPTLFKGYWNDHEKLHGVMQDGWWWTGDVGYKDCWGRFYQLDRAGDVIETSNGLVYSLLVEEVLLSYPGVCEAAVIGVKHPQVGAVPVAVIYPLRDQQVDPQACRAWANERLKLCTDLNAVFLVSPEEVPRGLTGKVLKRELREQFAASFTELGPRN